MSHNIALDPSNGKLYWIEGTGGDDPTAVIRRANLDGSGAEDIVTSALTPTSIALDPTNGKLYWGEIDFFSVGSGTGSVIRRANLDGSGRETVVAKTGIGTVVIGIALDLPNGKMYYAEIAVYGGASKIIRANLDGSSPKD